MSSKRSQRTAYGYCAIELDLDTAQSIWIERRTPPLTIYDGLTSPLNPDLTIKHP